MAHVTAERLHELVEQLFLAFREHNAVLGRPGRESILHPPASADDVAAFERNIGWEFPPSYRVFLNLHNGWEKFANVFTLTGVSGEHTRKARRAIEYSLSIYQQVWQAAHGAATPQAIAAFEARGVPAAKTEDEAGLYLPHQAPFATDFAGSLFFFNRRQLTADGEPEVVYRNQTGKLISRHADFVAFLEAELAFRRAKIAADRE